MSEKLVVIDYGMGNLKSVAQALERVAPDTLVQISSDPADIDAADRIVFPGQGAAGDCMRNIERAGLLQSILQACREKPFLGICMGLQVLLEVSDENAGTHCIGLIPGRVEKFDRSDHQTGFKVPHMGWNEVEQCTPHPLWEGIPDRARFYFVHSYFVRPDDNTWIAGSTDYMHPFASALARDNVFATQFHPEKSARDGLRLLHNFSRWSV